MSQDINDLLKLIVKPLVWTQRPTPPILLAHDPDEIWYAPGVGKNYRVLLRRGVWMYGLEDGQFPSRAESREEAVEICERDHRDRVAQRLDVDAVSNLVTIWRYINREVAS